MTNRMLNTADPTIVPVPTSPLAMKTPRIAVNNSGALEPAAMNVAPVIRCQLVKRKYYILILMALPATSSERFKRLEGGKNSRI